MALRLGTGGLKYPLPVAPDAQQSIAAASAGGSAASSAYGANRSFAANKMRVQADLANSAAERDFRARSQMEEQGFRAQQNFYDREHEKGGQLQQQGFLANEAEMRRNFDAYQRMAGENFQSNQANLDREFERERDQTTFDRTVGEQDAQKQVNIETGVEELNPQAQKKMDDIAAERAKMATDPQYSDEQRAEAERKFQERERRIRSTAGKPRVSPDQGWNQTVVHVDAEGNAHPKAIPGVTTAYDPKTRKPIVEKPDTSKEDAKRLAEEEKRARDIMNQAKENGEKITPEQAMSQARAQMVEEQAGFDRARNPLPHPPMLPPGSQGQPAQVPAPPAPAPSASDAGANWTAADEAERRRNQYPLRNQQQPMSTGQLPPPVPLPGKPVGPTPTPQTLPLNPATASSAGPVPLGRGIQSGGAGLAGSRGQSAFPLPGIDTAPAGAPPPGPGPGTAGMGDRARADMAPETSGRPNQGAYNVASMQNAMDNPDSVPQIKSSSDYTSLPSGAIYRDRMGNVKRKK